jgi:hypothetical protein
MMRNVVRTGLAALLLGGAALGCTKAAVRQKTPPDPLLVSKKPVEGVPQAAPPASVRAEVPPPPYPGGDVSTVSAHRPPAPPQPH